MKPQILLLEDDLSLGRSLSDRLQEEGHEIVWVKTTAAAKEKLTTTHFDLVILDIGLPDGTGVEVAKSMGSKIHEVPVIFLTAQSDAETRLLTYELGAQEFIPKPFHLRELLIRINHIFKEHKVANVIELPSVKIHLSEGFIDSATGMVYPSANEIKTLKLLIDRSPQAVSRDEIMDELWGEHKDGNTRTIDNIILKLRQLLGTEGDHLIRSVRGVGYQWMTTATTTPAAGTGKRED